MLRKVNKVGQDTLTVSLPKEWTTANKINKGDEVELEIKGNTITLFNKRKGGEKMIEIDAPEDDETAFRLVMTSYFQGADEIKINFKNKKSMRLIEKYIDYFIGFEIIERTNAQWTLRSITDIREGEFEKVLKRLFNLVTTMGNDIYESFKTGDLNTFDRIYALELTVNRLDVFCSRYTNSSGWKQFGSPTLYYIMVHKLEAIADAFTSISKHYSKIKKMTTKKPTLKLLEDVLGYLNTMQSFYYEFSLGKFRKIWEFKNNSIQKASNLYSTASREELLLISKLMDTTILIWEAASDIFDIKTAENPQAVGIFEKN